MKKLLSIALVVFMLISLVACGNGIDSNDDFDDDVQIDDNDDQIDDNDDQIEDDLDKGSKPSKTDDEKDGDDELGDLDEEQGKEDVSNNKPSNGQTVTAVLNTYSTTDEYGKAGTYTDFKNKKIAVGENVEVKATVNDGYNFEGWYINNVCVSETTSYSFTMKQNVELEARWSHYTLTTKGYMERSQYGTGAITENMGSVTTYENKAVSNGQKVKLVATVCDGYTFKGWYIGEFCVCEDLEYTYTMKKENVEIRAMFTYYTVSTDAFEFLSELEPDGRFPSSWDYNEFENFMGTYTSYEKKLVRVGESVTLTAEAKTGYKFIGWKCGDVIVSRSKTYTFVMEDEDVSYKAVFVKA